VSIQQAVTSGIDPLSIAVFESKLNHIAREMGIAMLRASRSPIFSQSHDFSCFITDASGRLISQADGVPIHTGAGGFAVRAVLDYWGDDIAPGDIFLSNDPYVAGGNHLPDLTVICPVFDGERIAFACNRAHQIDIGGGAPGTYNPDATEIFHEGLRVPPVKLFEKGKLRHDVLELVALNTRMPETVKADMQAMLGSVQVGGRGLAELSATCKEHSFTAHCSAVLDYAERIVRREIEDIPDGVYHGVDVSTHDGFAPNEIRIAVTITVTGSELEVDFKGSSPQVRSYKNSSLANTHAAVYVALSTLLGADTPHNEGSYRMVRVVAPKGSVVNPLAPAPVTFSTVHPTYEIVHAIWKALAPAVPGRVSSGWGKLCHPVTSGLDPNGKLFIMYHMAAQPGAGAMCGRDGFDQIGQLQSLGAITIPNLESYEQLYPIEFIKHEFRTDSAGAGQFRGGTGVEYALRMLMPTKNNLRGEGVGAQTGFGLCGGMAGASAELIIEPGTDAERALPVSGVIDLPPCTMLVRSSGGGGWGSPFDRYPEEVRQDVLDGILTTAAAAEQYGVVFQQGTLDVDRAATATLRQSRAAA